MGLRRATAADRGDLAALERACFGPDAWAGDAIDGALARAGGLGWLVGAPAGPVAYLLAAVLFEDAELLRVGVAPGERGRGHGDLLLQAFAAEAEARGATRLLLEVRADNTRAHALYARHGWEMEGRRRRYYADGCDALLFARRAAP
jgi:ribosomal-protein-alanine N-acetyltransferase